MMDDVYYRTWREYILNTERGSGCGNAGTMRATARRARRRVGARRRPRTRSISGVDFLSSRREGTTEEASR